MKPSADSRGKPLKDLRIIAVEQYGAGPFGTLHFAELGAEVIKIENPKTGGDVGRDIPPYLESQDSLYFQSLNRNKKSVSLDINSPAGRDVFHDLVRHADAVYCNFRGDVPERMGLRYEDLKHVNPRIVCCSLSGWGQTGPRRAQGAYDYSIQALSGWMDVTGEPDGPPTKTGLSLIDWSGGYVAALSMMVAIYAAKRDGVGMDCDVSLFDTALSFLTYYATWNMTRGYQPARTALSAHSSITPFQNFQTADGWIAVCCPNQSFWRKYAIAIERPDLLEDSRFTDFEARWENKDALLEDLTQVMLQRTTAEWVKILSEGDVTSAPVNSVPEALAEPQTAARDIIVTVSHPVYGEIKGVRSGVRAGPLNTDIHRAPSLGEHGRELLTGLLGYSDEKYAELEALGILGRQPESEPDPAEAAARGVE
jgi:crotonobetainyl-CoA:carnitine CoA-transferase CaiB-like acyl-CoA transferase